MKLIRLLLSLLLFLPLSYSFCIQFIQIIPTFNLQQPQIYFWAALAGMFLFALIFIKQASFVAIFKHELCHNLFGILTFHKPIAFHVIKDQGGEFHHTGKTNALMMLAPYFFPLASSIMMLISLLDIRAHAVFFTLLGLAFGFDLSTSIKDIHLKQSDFRSYGIFFSLCFILLLVLILYGMIAAYVGGRYSASETYFIEGFTQAWKRISMLWQ